MNALRTLALPALAATALLVGCSSEPAVDPAVGTWQLDGTATLEASKASMFADMSEEEQAAASGMMAKLFSSMNATMTFAADGTVEGVMDSPMGDASQKTSGTWTNDAGVLTLVTTDEGADEATTVTGNLEGDRFSVVMPADNGPEMTMVFARQAAEAK
ncbi:lipocalin family protein [Planctomycetes bacterium Pla163]